MELGNGKVGEMDWKFGFEGGKLTASLGYDGADLDAVMMLKFDASKILAALIDSAEEVIPGDQKMLAEMLKSYLANVMK
jgi:hypothetical protein